MRENERDVELVGMRKLCTQWDSFSRESTCN